MQDSTDWANVEKLMGGAVDLAAAARAYTPPVVVPSQVGRAQGPAGAPAGARVQGGALAGGARPSPGGPQVLAIHHGGGAGRVLAAGTGAPRALGGGGGKAADAAAAGPDAAARQGGGQLQGGQPPAPAGDEMVDLVFDPVLNCYLDQRTGQYWELRH